MEILLEQTGTCSFQASNGSGGKIKIDGPPDMGGKDEGLRPMESVLAALASCSAIDILHILKKGRTDVDDLKIKVIGKRVDAIPAVFESIELEVSVASVQNKDKLERAVSLSMEKYCSVAKMLEPTVKISYRILIK